MTDPEPLIPKYGGHRKLKSFRMAQLVLDVTALFCERYVDDEGGDADHMLQAAERGALKIAEGSQAGEVSKKTERKLTSMARLNLEELRREFESLLRENELPLWNPDDPRRNELTARRPTSLTDVEQWVDETVNRGTMDEPDPDVVAWANGALALIDIALSRLDRQLSAQTRVVEQEARVADRLRRRRLAEWPE
ncbi:MAG: four helix bundle protein [Dehalococcoidia bacterium]|jgi:hypothetical protein|nr:four helix bundle protein [Dehalococcoidia bacterium]